MLKCFNQVNNILSLSAEQNNQNRKEAQRQQLAKINIPTDPQLFYQDFGYLSHPKTGKPAEKLTDYQYRIWASKAKYRVVIKSQKVGVSTSSLLEDFQRALTTSKGKDILLIAQTQSHANEHLRTLKNLILNSDKYHDFLITNPNEFLLREEKTKVGIAYIKNPSNLLQPTRIIALGASEGSVWSWKNVSHIHMSDVTATNLVDDSSLFAAAFSRLANTDGTLLIETPPRRPKGKVYEIYEKYYKNRQKSKDFEIIIVRAGDAVREGLITQEFLDQERVRLGPLYSQFYEAEFLSLGGNVFAYEDIDTALLLGDKYSYGRRVNPFCLHVGGVDFGFSSSVSALYVAEVDEENNIIKIILGKEYDKKTPSLIANDMFSLHRSIDNLWWFVDGANRGAVNEIKSVYGEDLDWDKPEEINPNDNRVLPINFKKYHKEMLQWTYQLLTKKRLAIPRKYQKLVNSLRTAWAVEFDLDKDQTLDDDHLDALRLLLRGVKEESIDS